MCAMSAMSPGLAARSRMSVMTDAANKTPRPTGPGRDWCFRLRSAPVADQAQQHQEQVDEVEIELQRTCDGLATGCGAILLRIVHLLDPLRIPGYYAGEDENADRRDHEVEPGALKEDVHHHREDQPEQAHNQERADGRQIPPGRIALE